MNMAEENQDLAPEENGTQDHSTETTDQEVQSTPEASTESTEAEAATEEAVTEKTPYVSKPMTPPADFDWDVYEHGQSNYSESDVIAMEEKYNDTLNSINE